MNPSILWNTERPVSDFLDVPPWIDTTEDTLNCNDVAAILQVGCDSGAWMPAVTYSDALSIMGDHGDAVLDFIVDHLGELPKPDDRESWSGIAVFYLSYAVELFCCSIEEELVEAIEEQADQGDGVE